MVDYKVIKSRLDFPKLIDKLGLETGIEVGVREGFYSDYLLSNSNLKTLYGLDIVQDDNYIKPLSEKWTSRYDFRKGESPNYADNFSDSFFDFIYIDACHSYEAVKKDLEAWWPKVRNGGLFCGDDWIDAKNHSEGPFGVIEAVENFFENLNLMFYVTGCVENNRESRYNYGRESWQKLQEAAAQGNQDFQISQWWIIK